MDSGSDSIVDPYLHVPEVEEIDASSTPPVESDDDEWLHNLNW